MADLPDMSRRGFLLSSLAAARRGRARKAKMRKLSMAVGSYRTMSPFYLAHERGYFRDAGLDVTIHFIRNGPEALPLLAQAAHRVRTSRHEIEAASFAGEEQREGVEMVGRRAVLVGAYVELKGLAMFNSSGSVLSSAGTIAATATSSRQMQLALRMDF
jgi:hypothetical protein